MNDELKEAIKKLAAKAKAAEKACDALQFTQAALNLAHTMQVLKQSEA